MQNTLIYLWLDPLVISHEKGNGKVYFNLSFFSHATSVKKAVSDLQFKIISETLKKEPIHKDTDMTVKYYRLITGACDHGVRSWMKNNKIPFTIVDEGTVHEATVEKKPIKASELLPMLQKTNAYGIEKIKQLITF